MNRDAFSKCHPAVNFIFFLCAIAAAVLIQHPAYLLAGVICAACYLLLLKGRKAVKGILLLLPFALLMAVVNPLLNTRGDWVLFYIFGRPYTLEALLYGCAVGGVFLVMMLWFGCYNAVMTGDKFTSLFGNLIPSLSLLLVMILRLVPELMRKVRQALGARSAIGKGTGQASSAKEKAHTGMAALSSVLSWALEGSLVTADSMRSRGYGTAKRSSFMIYRMSMRDYMLLGIQLALMALVVLAAVLGQTHAEFLPVLSVAPVSWGLLVYCGYLLIPTVLFVKEAIQWHISRSRI